MTAQRLIARALTHASDAGDDVVLATVVHVTGSSYGGVGTRMLIRVDGSTVGLVSGGCLESDLAEHARTINMTGVPTVVTYDTRRNGADEAVWGLGLGCNGLIDVLLEPLTPERARSAANMLNAALAADSSSVLATVVRVDAPEHGDSSADETPATRQPALGAHALIIDGRLDATGDWGDTTVLDQLAAAADDARAAGRHGLIREYRNFAVAFEVIQPAVRLVICGSGPDVVPVASLAGQLGWDVVVVDHRAPEFTRPDRFVGASVVSCTHASELASVVPLTPRTAVVVMSHNFDRDAEYLHALLAANIAYVGVLGPRARTDRMLAQLDSHASGGLDAAISLYAPLGLDVGGEGPDAIALALIAEVSAAASGRTGGHLRDLHAPLHGRLIAPGQPRIGAVVLAAGASSRMGSPKQLLEYDRQPLVRRAALAAKAAGSSPVVVVLGANAAIIAPVLADLDWVTVVVNDDWHIGLASSLAKGIGALRQAVACDAVLVTLADQPLVDALALGRLVAEFDATHPVVASAYGKAVGVPAVFAREYLDDLLRLTGDSGAGPWLRDHPELVTRVSLDAAALDIDTPADAARLAGIAANGAAAGNTDKR